MNEMERKIIMQQKALNKKKIEEINYVVYSLNTAAKTITPITDKTRDTDTLISAIFLQSPEKQRTNTFRLRNSLVGWMERCLVP